MLASSFKRRLFPMIPIMPRNAGGMVRTATIIALGLEKTHHSIKAVRNAPKITKNIFHLFSRMMYFLYLSILL